jgi:hypothetical protein
LSPRLKVHHERWRLNQPRLAGFILATAPVTGKKKASPGARKRRAAKPGAKAATKAAPAKKASQTAPKATPKPKAARPGKAGKEGRQRTRNPDNSVSPTGHPKAGKPGAAYYVYSCKLSKLPERIPSL